MTEPFRPSPVPDPHTAPLWDAARGGELHIQRCLSCRSWIHYPRAVCPTCLSTELGFEPVSGWGVVYSFTWAHRPGGRTFADKAPYLVAIVELDEQVRLMTTVEGGDVAVGQRVRLARFEETADGGPPVPIFQAG